jgi:hypothetical protein
MVPDREHLLVLEKLAQRAIVEAADDRIET